MSETLARLNATYTEQVIENFQKKRIPVEVPLCLKEDHIAYGQEISYPLKEVLDVSYRYEPGKIGFLYVHTIQGIRTFQINSDPGAFVEQFHRLDHL
ncbi:hypothetical protein CHL76_04800 [Marinococcus halophilus]|uniref:Uncharacterized protein n=1 Tax=Marinococcus halophilus TaxID=1371 RepID=A0A510Y620_MARHA|nr:hypothetical protein [Marinococcus halophilus]OZT81092.1 hypothetical protein CHL76_04800 [Marinococcus halophilus]GEK58808.1 hypothetical protein MHA01_17130 [Marinococcus halophilus]